MDFKKYDKGGDIWYIDRSAKRIRRKQVEQDLDRIERQGFYTKFAAGDKVLYDADFVIKEAEVLRPVDDNMYEILVDGTTIIVPGELLCDRVDLF